MDWTRFLIIFGATILLAGFTHRVLPAVVTSTKTRLDDFFGRALTAPIVGVGTATAIWQSHIAPEWFASSGAELGWQGRLPLLLGGMSLLWIIVTRFISRWLRLRSAASVSELDDVVIPVLTRQIFPVLMALLSILMVFWVFGQSLATGIATAGGLSFILVYLLQEPLSNLFGGLALALDVPFTYNDLITLEDGKTYEVRRIGSRVTHLYDVAENNLVFYPNVRLTQQRLINLVQPNVQQRIQLVVGVGYETHDLQAALKLLQTIALQHPNVLATEQKKLEALSDPDPKIQFERFRIKAEHKVRSLGERIIWDLAELRRAVQQEQSQKQRETVKAALTAATTDLLLMHESVSEWGMLLGYSQVLYRSPVAPLDGDGGF